MMTAIGGIDSVDFALYLNEKVKHEGSQLIKQKCKNCYIYVTVLI